jgi:hypothetical protein
MASIKAVQIIIAIHSLADIPNKKPSVMATAANKICILKLGSEEKQDLIPLHA